MDGNDFGLVVIVGLFCVLAFIMGANVGSDRGRITSQKEFIMGTASYKCIKTNELRGE